MSLSQVSTELLVIILKHCVQARCLKRALRLRLVNRVFRDCAVEAILQSDIVERESMLFRLTANNSQWFWKLYLRRYVYALRPASRYALIITNVARYLSKYDRQSELDVLGDLDYEDYVDRLCDLVLANMHLQSEFKQYMEGPDEQDVQELLSSDYFHQHLISAAAYFGIYSLVLSLCKHGYHDQGNSFGHMFPGPAACAVYAGHHEILRYLEENYPDPKNFVGYPRIKIKWAAEAGNDEMMESALAPHWNRNLDDFLRALYNTKSTATLRRFLPQLESWLCDRTRRALPPYPEIQEKMLAYYTAEFLPDRLLSAARQGLTEMVEYLINEIKAPFDVGSAYYMTCAYRPILYAARYGHADIVRILLRQGARPGRALEEAAVAGYGRVVSLLLDHGDVQESVVRNALRKAIEREQDDIIRLLQKSIITENTVGDQAVASLGVSSA